MTTNPNYVDDAESEIINEDIEGITYDRPTSVILRGHCHNWSDNEDEYEEGTMEYNNSQFGSRRQILPDVVGDSGLRQNMAPVESERFKRGRRAEKVLWVVVVLSVIFITAEFIGGLLASSLAIMTDAGHMLSDLLSFVISIFAIRYARLPASQRLSFGYERAEVLGAFSSIIILWVLTTILVFTAVLRIINQDYDVNSDIMLISAGVGVAFNIIMGLVLHFGTGGHGHSHGASSGHSHNSKNVNIRAALIHVIGDLVQSIGVLIAAIIIKFTGWSIADPICTFFFSIIVLFTTITVIRDIFYVLMEGTPHHSDIIDMKKALEGIDGVKGVHDLHLWSIGMDKTAFSVHLALESNERAMETVAEARYLARSKFGVSVATVQVEPFDAKIESCEKCRSQST